MCYIGNTGYYKEQMTPVMIGGKLYEVLLPDGTRFCDSCGYDSVLLAKQGVELLCGQCHAPCPCGETIIMPEMEDNDAI